MMGVFDAPGGPMSQGKVVIDLSMSLDGYIAAPHDRPDNGLGDGGEVLHDWGFNTDYGAKYYAETIPAIGALVFGRRTYDNSAPAWGKDERGTRGPHDPTPCFVLSHRPRPADAGPVFTFVGDGIESAIKQAMAAAAGKNVRLMGGMASDQAIKAGLVDELILHVVPILFGGGVRLLNDVGSDQIKLETKSAFETDGVTHLVYRVAR